MPSPVTREELIERLGRLRADTAEVLGLLRSTRDGESVVPEARASSAPLNAEAMQLVAEHAFDMISLHSPNGDYLFASPSSRALLGLSPAELVGRSAYEFFHPDDIDRIARDHAGHDAAKPGLVRYRLRQPDNSYKWVETRSSAHRTSDGVQQIIAITRDVHDEMRGQLGTLVSRLIQQLSHEINNPLMLALNVLDDPSPDANARMRYALLRISGAVRQLAMLAALGDDTPRPLALEDVVTQTAATFGHDECIQIEASPATVVAEPRLVHQLVQALLLAFLHGPEQALVRVRCGRIGREVELSVEGSAHLVGGSMRADFAAVLRGEAPEPALPLKLAERLAQTLGGFWRIEDVSPNLRITVRLPDRETAPPRAQPKVDPS